MNARDTASTPDTTSTRNTASTRRAGLVGAVGGALTLASGVVVQGLIQPTTAVSNQMWSYPWSSSALVPVSLVYAVFHLMIIIGVLGYWRAGVAGNGRAARIGAVVTVTGTAVLAAAELLSIPVADQRVDDRGASLVGAAFGIGSVLSAVGFLVLGVATVRAARWQGWRRFVALALGVWLLVTAALAATPALAVAVAVYGLLLTALGVALYTQPAPDASRPRSGTIQL